MTLGDSPEFIRWTFEPDGSATLDRPNSFQFNIPLVTESTTESSTTALKAGTLTFAGSFEADVFAGRADDGAQQGDCELWPLRELAGAEYRPLMGSYRLGAEREVILCRDSRDEERLYFYAEQDQVVRLHPLGGGRFLSECCEIISATVDEHGVVQALTWADHGADHVTADPAGWWTEEDVRVPSGDHVLAGTLLLPPGAGPHPLVILCHHASIHARDYYRIFAEPFVRRGSAAFIYDKRGHGESTGKALWSQIFLLADDAGAVLRQLRQHPAIRPDAVGLWGISNGAWVIAITAERAGEPAFLIAASGAGVSPARQEQYRRANVAAALSASPRAVDMIERFWSLMFQFRIDGRWSDELEEMLRQVYADEELQKLPRHPDHGPYLQPVPPTIPIEEIRAEWGGSWQEGGFDPAPIYTGLRCPILCVWGEQDDVVLPDESRQRIAHALEQSNHPDYDLRVVPNTTHMLYVPTQEPSGALAETMHAQLHNVVLAPGLREFMADWAAERVLG